MQGSEIEKLSDAHNPLLVRRGGRGAAGVVAHTEVFGVSRPPLLVRSSLTRLAGPITRRNFSIGPASAM